MRGKLANVFSVFVVLTLMMAAGACKKNIPAQPGYGGTESSPYGTMGAGSGGGLDDARWRELGITTEEQRKGVSRKGQEFRKSGRLL